MTIILPRETSEFLPITVTVLKTKEVITEGVQFAITADRERPLAFIDAVVEGTEIGINIEGFAPGYYTIWTRVSTSIDAPVIKCGTILID